MKLIAFMAEANTPEELEQVKIALVNLFSNAYRNETITNRNETVTENKPLSNAERQKRYRERNKSNETVTESQEERENEKEAEKERSKEKEEEKVKEKEELINIYAGQKNSAVTKPQKHKHGNFQHVLLTDDEFSRIQSDFLNWQDRIQRLDDYLENNPSKHYANHNLTIRNWAKREAEEATQKQPKQIPKEKTFHDIAVERGLVEPTPSSDFVDSFWRN